MPSSYDDFYGSSVPLWVSGATVQQWQCVRSPGDGQVYVRRTATGSGVTDPKDDSANYWPSGGRAIKSVQSGIFDIYSPSTNISEALATVSAVNLAKSILIPRGCYAQTATGQVDALAVLEMASATQVRARRGTTGIGDRTSVSYTLLEFH